MVMNPVIEIAGARVFHGDCRDVLRSLPDNSVDSVVTDPPYELGFMGKSWDSSGIAYDVTVWQECLRVLKPGGHVLAFGGSRTWHRLAVAVEDAGFELRDSIAWLYGSGFPKSLDVSKAIEKKLGVKPIGKKPAYGAIASRELIDERGWNNIENALIMPETQTEEGKQWQGWGTALKPAFEPVVVGRKPLIGTVAENVLAWGVGGLNIDGSRIAGEVPTREQPKLRPNGEDRGHALGSGTGRNGELSSSSNGRWPANVILDEVSAGLLDEQSGIQKDGVTVLKNAVAGNSVGNLYDGGWKRQTEDITFGGSGGASRFFYVAKASKRDRNEGLEELEEKSAPKGNHAGRNLDNKANHLGGLQGGRSRNFHPTVKPTQLMRYLIKLVTPPGGTVLDPFTGSGSTGKAALLDGYRFVGAELTEEYLPIIEGRLRWASEQVEGEDVTLF